MTMTGVRIGSALCVGVMILSVSGCSSSKKVKAETAQNDVTTFVQQNTGYRPTDVKCPNNVKNKSGQTFTCSYTDAARAKKSAKVRISSVTLGNPKFEITLVK